MRLLYLTLPQHWAVALVNGDFTACTDDEVAEIEAFTDHMVATYGSCHCVDVHQDDHFTAWHDAVEFGAVYATTVNTFVFDITSAASFSPQSSGKLADGRDSAGPTE